MKMRSFLPLLIIASLFISPSISFAETSPLAPTNLTADVQESSVTLTWTPPVDTTVAGFNVYRQEDLAGAGFIKANSKLVTESSYKDKDVSKGKSYLYICKAVNTDGIEGAESNKIGAPKMKMNTSAVVTHMGKAVRIATPGDVIKYSIDFANNGFGIAKNVVIVYGIPKGTTFMTGTANCPKYKVNISYYDEKAGKWIDKVNKEENISRVRFAVQEDVLPLAKDKNDTASLKVMVNY